MNACIIIYIGVDITHYDILVVIILAHPVFFTVIYEGCSFTEGCLKLLM